jgi:hypothetical protein
LTMVTREIQPRLAAKAWLEQASRRSAEWSPFRISDPWLNCCLQADTLIDVACVRWIISPVKIALLFTYLVSTLTKSSYPKLQWSDTLISNPTANRQFPLGKNYPIM